MSTSTALGSFEIHDASSDIRAVVSSSVTTYGTESTLSSTSILDLLRSPLTWVSQGRDLRLRIRIVCEEHARSDLALAADVYQAAQTAIINAELWNQLHLKPTLVREPQRELPRSLRHADVDVGILRSPCEENHSRKAPHKLVHGGLSNTIDPPCGIRHVYLETVDISILLGLLSDQVEVFPKHDHGNAHNHEAYNSMLNGDEDWDTSLNEQGGIHSRTLSPTPCAVMQAENIDDFIALEQCCKDEVKNATSIATEIKAAQFLGVLDASVRLTISERPSRLRKGLKMVVDERISYLDTACPAVWRIGYLQAVSHRACLIQTFTNVFSMSMMGRTCSLVLRERLRNLLGDHNQTSAYRHPDINVFCDEVAESDAGRDVLATQLWSTLQTHLQKYAKQAPRAISLDSSLNVSEYNVEIWPSDNASLPTEWNFDSAYYSQATPDSPCQVGLDGTRTTTLRSEDMLDYNQVQDFNSVYTYSCDDAESLNMKMCESDFGGSVDVPLGRSQSNDALLTEVESDTDSQMLCDQMSSLVGSCQSSPSRKTGHILEKGLGDNLT